MTPLDNGVKINVRGFEFVVPELVLGDREMLEDEGTFEVTEELRRIRQRLNQIEKPSDELLKKHAAQMRKSTEAMIHVVTVALRRNYPDISEELVRREFNMSRLLEAFAAALGVKGGGQAATTGEGHTAALNGAVSTATS